MVSLRQISFPVCALGLLLGFALVPLVFAGAFFRLAIGDLVPLLVAVAATMLTLRNAFDSRGHARLFWSLMAAGMAMWSINQAGWVWFEIILRKPLPDPFFGDVVLFLHLVPIMAAVAIRPHQVDDRDGMLPSTLNVLILLIWWVIVYAFAVFPDEYIVTNVPVYNSALGSVVPSRRVDPDRSVRLVVPYEFRSLAKTLWQHLGRQRCLQLRLGCPKRCHCARYLRDRWTLRRSFSRRPAGILLGCSARTPLS